MVSKILVAIDKSDLSSAAFNQAMSLANAVNAKLILLHVLSHAEEGSPQMVNAYTTGYTTEVNEILWQTYEKEWNAFVQEYQELLQWRTNEAKMAGVNAEFIHTSGSPGRTICEVARNQDIDLIVIGSHGRAGLKELFLGSVSNYVMHHAPCSVLVVHPREKTEQHYSTQPPPEERDQLTSA